MTPFFSRRVDKRSRAALIAFLTQHARYSLGPGRSTYAHDVKVYHLGLPTDLEHKAYQALGVAQIDAELTDLRRAWWVHHQYRYDAAFEGRSGGHLVLLATTTRPAEWQSYCPRCGQKNFQALRDGETGQCGRCRQMTRINITWRQAPLRAGVHPVDPGEDWADWSMDDLRARVALVQDFDAFADALRDTFITLLRDHDIGEETYYVPRQRSVLVPA